ncbi:hypothetical protein [Kitasatospora sp. LaBMicrA B282]|uniref:hypothetical protein n=1 Tax=Kitasatospora sp. LaBMicrA B282 TaxID=3420949 RepID=UPI003D0B2FE9
MPSLRQPVGPLPASIYWRRRVVVIAAFVVAVILILWMTMGQGGGDKQPAAKPLAAPNTPTAPASITPGATPTGPAINSYPGGSSGGSGGASGGGGATSGGASGGGAGGGTGGTGGGSGTGGSGGSAAGGTGGSGSTGSGGSGGSGGAPAINTSDVMALPACIASQLTLELAGTQESFQPQDKPTFELKIHNASGNSCRVDLSQTASTITVSSTTGRIWSSADCPTDKQSRWVQVSPANVLTETFTWDRSYSKPACPSPTASTAAPIGKYSVQVDLTGPAGGPIKALITTQLVVAGS